MAKTEKRPLGGEADPKRFHVTDASGEPVDIKEAVFPIFRRQANGDMKLIGTGFFLTNTGVFATARHVLRDAFDASGKQVRQVDIVHMLADGTLNHRPVSRFVQSNKADVAVGFPSPAVYRDTNKPLTNPVLRLTLKVPEAGEAVWTYAYPNTTVLNRDQIEVHMFPDYYSGEFVCQFPNGRDRGLLPHPCFQTSIMSHGGSSGGPVFDSQGRVFGINCTGMAGEQIAHSSRVHELLELPLRGTLGAEESIEQTFTIGELARKGQVVFDPPL